jgi:Concanavalin A-like lectin/glucanases superfamily
VLPSFSAASRGQFFPGGLPRIDWSHSLAQGLTAFWYDTGNGIFDLVTGTYVAASYKPRTSRVGLASGFDGTTPGINIASNDRTRAASMNGAFSIASGFTKTGTAGAYGGPLARSANNGSAAPYANYALEINAGSLGQNRISFFFINGAGSSSSFYRLQPSGSYPTDGPYSTMVGTARAGDQRLYFNGALAASDTQANVGYWNTQDAINYGSPTTFNGLIYYCAIWSRVLSAGEAALLHAQPTSFLIYSENQIANLLVGSAVSQYWRSQTIYYV